MRRFNYHVFTPFSRFQNLLYLSKKLLKLGVHWHIILDADVPFTIKADHITAYVCPNKEPGWFVGHWYQNWFVENAPIVDGDRYSMLSDDDDYEEAFFDTIDAVDGDVLVFSMKRPGVVLIAEPGNMTCGRVGGEQIMMTGRILKQFRWAPDYSGDFTFLKSVIDAYPPVYVPDARVWWNVKDTSKPLNYP